MSICVEEDTLLYKQIIKGVYIETKVHLQTGNKICWLDTVFLSIFFLLIWKITYCRSSFYTPDVL